MPAKSSCSKSNAFKTKFRDIFTSENKIIQHKVLRSFLSTVHDSRALHVYCLPFYRCQILKFKNLFTIFYFRMYFTIFYFWIRRT